MSRKIIIFIDGTGCRATSGLRKHFTNVFKTSLALSTKRNRQISLYFPGPASRQILGQVVHSIIGSEINDILLEAYLALVNNTINPAKDRIYIFGYSRGAAVAKALVSMLERVGLLRREHLDVLLHAYKAYAFGEPKSRMQILGKCDKVEVQFVGLFDTVVGPKSKFIKVRVDDTLATNVRHAVEIVSIDERRKPYEPHLWRDSYPNPFVAKVARPFLFEPHSRLQQIWLPGGHADVGDPAGNNLIGDVAFLTMIERLQAKTDLRLSRSYIQQIYDNITSEVSSIQIKKALCLRMADRALVGQRCSEVHPLYNYIADEYIIVNGNRKVYRGCAANIESLRQRLPTYYFAPRHIKTRSGLEPHADFEKHIKWLVGQAID